MFYIYLYISAQHLFEKGLISLFRLSFTLCALPCCFAAIEPLPVMCGTSSLHYEKQIWGSKQDWTSRPFLQPIRERQRDFHIFIFTDEVRKWGTQLNISWTNDNKTLWHINLGHLHIKQVIIYGCCYIRLISFKVYLVSELVHRTTLH